jgi:hypothetical protein
MLVLLLSVLVISFCAFGDTGTTQWNITNTTSGSYSYAGGTSVLVGTGIGVENILGSPTPLNTGSPNELAIVGGSLDFTSGANTGGWTWGSPGTLSITGCIAALGLGTITGGTCTTAATLLSDDFTSVSISPIPVSGSPLGVEFGQLQGTMNGAIASYFGISTIFTSPASTGQDVLFGLPPSGPGDAFAGVTSTAPGGNLSLVSPVPENWSLFSTLGLFGFGLAAFGLAGRFGLKAIQF